MGVDVRDQLRGLREHRGLGVCDRQSSEIDPAAATGAGASYRAVLPGKGGRAVQPADGPGGVGDGGLSYVFLGLCLLDGVAIPRHRRGVFPVNA